MPLLPKEPGAFSKFVTALVQAVERTLAKEEERPGGAGRSRVGRPRKKGKKRPQ